MSDHSNQQRQTLSFFRGFAEKWHQRAQGGKQDKFNLILRRNACVVEIVETMVSIQNFLDIGCGSGELVFEIAERKINAVGIDFADEMIALCEKKRLEKGNLNVEFFLKSFLEYEPADESFDLISGLGLIEYISPGELKVLIERCKNWLRRDGKLVLGSRNRLFNLFSLNDYTEVEIGLGTLEQLMGESVAIATSATVAEAIQRLKEKSAYLTSPETHPKTGIDVATRYQYTPGELVRLLEEAGFNAETLFGVHYHAFPPDFIRENEPLHVDTANHLFETAAKDHRLIPSSSTFVIVAQKT
jgi:2-polyprenyl-3-methyl-5-hydroxy-6-metoxy-1,4-benzoquinol methylase